MNDSPKKKRGRPSNGFDKKKYDRDRLREIRAKAKAIRLETIKANGGDDE